MNRILFVDDGREISPEQRDALLKYGRNWQVSFVSSAGDALAALAAEPYDVVVSGIHAPQVDSTALLVQVKSAYPRTARIALASSDDRAAIMRTLPVAQQVITRPCVPEQWWRIIERTCCLNGLMGSETIRHLVGGLDKLPSVPRSYVALTQAMAREDVELAEIVAIVERDTAMSIKLLQLANSAFFGRPRKITSISQTVSYLGLDLLKALALSAHVFGMLEGSALQSYGLAQLQERSLLTAQLAKRFLSDSGRGEEGFTAGLLQDVGRIVLATCLKERYMEVVERSRRSGTTLHAVERETFGVTHAEVGAYLLSLWGLPAAIIEAVAFHHNPDGVLHDDTDLVDAIHMADALADEMATAPGSNAAAELLELMLLPGDKMASKLLLWRQMATQGRAGTRP